MEQYGGLLSKSKMTVYKSMIVANVLLTCLKLNITCIIDDCCHMDSFSCLQMQNYSAVVDHTNKVLLLQPTNVKAMFRKGKVNL